MQTTLVKTTESNSKNLFDRMMSMRCLTLTINSLFFMLHGVTSLMLIIYPSQNWLGIPKQLLQQNKYLLALETEFEFAIMSMTISVSLLLIINSNHPNLIENTTAAMFVYWSINLAFRTYLGYTSITHAGLPTFFALSMCITAWFNYLYPIDFKKISEEFSDRIEEISSHEVENQTTASSPELLGTVKSAA